MTRLSKFFMFFAACILGLSACNNDDGGKIFETVWGSVFLEDDIIVYGDDNTVYTVEENDVKWFPFQEEQRVIIGFYVEEEQVIRSAMNIHLLAIDSIRKKDALLSSELTQEEITGLGDDPMYIYSAWLGGYNSPSSKELFLNMECGVNYPRCVLNAVLDEANSTNENKIINIYHKALGPGIVYSTGKISFSLADILGPSYDTPTTITIKWHNYDNEDRSNSIKYDGNLGGVTLQSGFINMDHHTNNSDTRQIY